MVTKKAKATKSKTAKRKAANKANAKKPVKAKTASKAAKSKSVKKPVKAAKPKLASPELDKDDPAAASTDCEKLKDGSIRYLSAKRKRYYTRVSPEAARKRRSEWAAAYRAKRIKAGLCINCGKKSKGRAICAECKKKHNDSQTKRRKSEKKAA